MKKILLVLPILLMACTKPDTPAQDVYAAESTYAGALRLELAYSDLPRCGKPSSPPLCSDQKVLKSVRTADDAAWEAIQQAQTAVRTPGYGDSKVTTVVASAQALTKAFVGVANQLKLK